MTTHNDSKPNFLELTDCLHFIAGSCAFKNKCYYRHSQAAISQSVKCPNWPASCRNVTCPYRHPAMLLKTPERLLQAKGSVIFLWHIESVPVTKGQKIFDIVQRIRQKFVTERDLQELEFSCCCNSTTLSEEHQKNLDLANVRMIHVPDRKPGAIDRQIIFELDRFERYYRPPASIVLISENIAYLGKISDLRHRAGFQVIVIQNKTMNNEVKAIVNEHYSWQSFIQPLQKVLPQSHMSNDIRGFMNSSIDSPLILSAEQNTVERINTRESRLSTQETSQRRARSVIVRHRASHHSRLPISNVEENRSTVMPQPQMRPMSRNHRSNRRSASNRKFLQAVANVSSNNTRYSFFCPLCTNEFNTVKALRQHQTDKNHLFYCLICKESFATENAIEQHQKAKNHFPTNNTTDHDFIQLY